MDYVNTYDSISLIEDIQYVIVPIVHEKRNEPFLDKQKVYCN